MNLPHAPVYWLTVQEPFHDLVIATYGRGFWILDDVSPLRQLAANVLSADAHLFAPRPAYRWRDITAPYSPPNDPTVGQDPPDGASIDFYLKSPADSLAIRIEDQNGQPFRTLQAKGQAGINRVYWDLRGEPTPEVQLRTRPLYAPYVPLGPNGWRSGGARMSVLAPPGAYTVKLTVNGKELAERLEVSRQTVNALEVGKYDPSLPLAFKIAWVFGQPIEAIFQPDVPVVAQPSRES